jgi:hypothetical protein
MNWNLPPPLVSFGTGCPIVPAQQSIRARVIGTPFGVSELTQLKFISVSVVPVRKSVADDPTKYWELKSSLLEAPRSA